MYRFTRLLGAGEIDPLCRLPTPLYHFSVHTSNDRAGDILEVSIWTTVEPSVAVISACLPTLRPLFRAARPLLYNFNSRFRSQGSLQRRDYDIQLNSIGGGTTNGVDFSERAEWANRAYINQPPSAVTRSTITASGNMDHDPERDDKLLSDINVQHEVSVIRSGR